MKKLKYLCAAALLLAAMFCGGCKAKPSDTPQTTQPTSGTSQAAPTPTEKALPTESADTDTTAAAKPADGTTAATKKAETSKAPADTEKATTQKAGTTKAADTTKPAGTTKKEATSLKPGKAVTTTAKASTTTKPAATTKAAQTTKPSDTTKPSGSGTQPVVPSATTAQPVAKGNAVAGTLTFLNEAKSDYVSGLTARNLEAFGITGDLQKQILKNPKEWNAYTIRIDFENKETMPVTLYYLNVPDNGKNDIYVNGENMGELGLPVGGKMSQQFHVLAPASISDGFVLQKLHTMKMDIQYAATPKDDSVMPSFVYASVN